MFLSIDFSTEEETKLNCVFVSMKQRHRMTLSFCIVCFGSFENVFFLKLLYRRKPYLLRSKLDGKIIVHKLIEVEILYFLQKDNDSRSKDSFSALSAKNACNSKLLVEKDQNILSQRPLEAKKAQSHKNMLSAASKKISLIKVPKM